MKVGDLVKYKRNRFDEATGVYDGSGPTGLIVDIKNNHLYIVYYHVSSMVRTYAK